MKTRSIFPWRGERRPVPLLGASAARALTIIEVVIAFAIAVIFLAGLMASLGAARRSELFTTEHQAASDVAFEKLGYYSGQPFSTLYDKIVSGDATATSVEFAAPVSFGDAHTSLTAADNDFWAQDATNPTYPLHVYLTRPDPSDPDGDYGGDGAGDYITIEVVVAWKSFDGSNAKVVAETRVER